MMNGNIGDIHFALLFLDTEMGWEGKGIIEMPPGFE